MILQILPFHPQSIREVTDLVYPSEFFGHETFSIGIHIFLASIYPLPDTYHQQPEIVVAELQQKTQVSIRLQQFLRDIEKSPLAYHRFVFRFFFSILRDCSDSISRGYSQNY